MQLPESFTFSQFMLQDYIDCEFRFLLRHLRKLDWPAVESEPVLLNQEKMELGYAFHRLVQQYFAGIDPAILETTLDKPELISWWHNFLDIDLINMPGIKFAEKLVTIPFAGFRLSAKYDLLILGIKGEAQIYDWKTSQHLPPITFLRTRVQSRIYPLVQYEIQLAGKIKGNELLPGVEMTYWFPEFPDQPLSFFYDHQGYTEDRLFLETLLHEIQDKDEEQFHKTENEKKCQFCHYRSLCDRGFNAGTFSTVEDADQYGEDPFDIALETDTW